MYLSCPVVKEEKGISVLEHVCEEVLEEKQSTPSLGRRTFVRRCWRRRMALGYEFVKPKHLLIFLIFGS